MLPESEAWSGLAAGTLRWRGKFDSDNDEFWRDYLDGKTTERVYCSASPRRARRLVPGETSAFQNTTLWSPGP